jgi:hypothetical protein
VGTAMAQQQLFSQTIVLSGLCAFMLPISKDEKAKHSNELCIEMT